jgi:transposase
VGGLCVSIRGCRPTAAPTLPRSAPHARPDVCARLSCSPRATPKPRSPARSASRQAASRWHARFANGGVDALRSRGPTGPDPKVSDAQLAEVEQVLLEGAIAAGFDTDLWTLERVATVIERLTGVRYHPGHVWWILHQRLGWTVQRPERRASERDEQAIARWVAHEWPRIKRGQPQNRPGLSSSTNRPSR